MASIYDERPWLALYDDEDPATLTPEFGDALALFRHTRDRVPDRVALTYFDGRVTYGELDRLSDGLARYLAENKFGGGDRLAVYLQNVPQFVIALLAGWKLGGIVVPLNPMYRSHELSTILADAQPSAIVSSEVGWHDVMAEAARAAGVHTAVTTSELDLQTRHDSRLFARTERSPASDAVDLLEVARARQDRSPAEVTIAPSDIALLTYTSGPAVSPRGPPTPTATSASTRRDSSGARATRTVPGSSRWHRCSTSPAWSASWVRRSPSAAASTWPTASSRGWCSTPSPNTAPTT